jgi:stage II sporulation protein P
MPGRVAVRRVAIWPGRRLSSLLPSTSVLIFLLFLWGAWQVIPHVASWRGYSFQSLLAWGLPNTISETEESRSWLILGMVGLTGIDPLYLPSIMDQALPAAVADAAAGQSVTAASPGVEHSPNAAGVAGQPADLSKLPVLVAIYYTHNAETYVPYQGKAKVEGENGGVTVAGNEMVKILAQARIRAVQDLTIHDYPDYPTSYIKSEPTAKRLAEENPELKVLLDVHRDAGLPAKETVSVGGQDSARIMIVVGNDNNLPYPHWEWQENYAFAQKVARGLEERYPGVLKQVRLKDGRYNQHISPGAILVEVGSEKNTLDEVLVASRCFATVLAGVIGE